MSVQEKIKQQIEANNIVLFMKGNAEMPMCGFSARAVNILKACDVQFATVDVLKDEEIRNGIKVYSNWPTIPQLYVKGEFIGGCDIVREMFQANELQSVLADKGVSVRQAAG